MSQVTVKGMLFDAEVAPLLPRMDSVNGHREALQRLQDNWDHLTLLGQMSGIAADITATGEEFKALSGKLLNTLAHRLRDNVVQALQGKSQVAIDILVRNLFERTADVGFLATDTAVRQVLTSGQDAEAMQRTLAPRFKAYVAKYSVYDDVIVLGTDGRVLARLDEQVAASHCRHGFLSETLRGQQAFVECFDRIDLLDGRRGLMYAAPIRDERTQLLGALTLSFKLEDEMAGIFGHLIDGDPFQMLLLCDARGEVIGSSDALRIPAGARLGIDPDQTGHQCICFAGRLYLAVTTRSTGYQGYMGPGWLGCALVPLENAFDDGTLTGMLHGQAPTKTPALAIDARAFFDETLQAIPRQAKQIQKGLERSVWNWELHTRHQTGAQAADNNRFAAALLQQVSVTGERIRNVFEQAINELGASVAASVLHDTTFRASLAIDIMDRNLYERANDCRWWSLDGSLREALRRRDAGTQRKACEVLAHINSLYTVYTRLVLVDTQGEVVAMSGADAQQWLGRTLDMPCLRSAMQLGDHQAWTRSGFEPSPLYDGRPTYVYAAAVQSEDGKALGAIAIVFDGAPQFRAMLQDALPVDELDASGTTGQQGEPRMSALFVTRAGLVVSSTDGRFEPATQLPLPAEVWATLQPGQSIGHVFHIDGVPHAAGISTASGYREYRGACNGKACDVLAMVLLPVRHPPADHDEDTSGSRIVIRHNRPAATDRTLATFLSAGQHIGIDADQVIEAMTHRRLTAMPGSPSHLAGLLLHQGKMLPVMDLRALRGHGGHAPTHRDTQADGGITRMLVVCRNRDGFRFALIVDDLAGIMTVPDHAHHPLPEGMDRHDPTAEGIVRGQEGSPQGAMMIVLNLDRLASCLHGRREAA
jgi:chemotaxis signal transduction protein